MAQELASITVKMPMAMKTALENLAQKEFTSVSGLLKKGAEKLLLEHGIDWREAGKKGKAK